MRLQTPVRLAAALFLVLMHTLLHAEITLLNGRPQIGFEIEHEKAPGDTSRSNSMTLFPGIVWEDGWITRAELLLMHERDAENTPGGVVRSNGSTFGVRLRKDVAFTEEFGGFLRGLIGRASNADATYNYGYIEPALRWESQGVELYAGYRIQRSFDHSTTHDLNQLRFGPGWDITDHHGVDLRWTRSWQARTDLHVSDALEVEYCYRF